MESFLVSTAVVAVAEIGDKTQLLALVLGARFRRPLPIMAGILLATLANHALAAWAGVFAAAWLAPDVLRWALGLSFLAMAVWALIPDKADADPRMAGAAGAFAATLISFFLVEIGDKTQIATVALAARFDAIAVVTLGTTLGMMIANAPAVALGDVAVKKVPFGVARAIAAAIFGALGIAALVFPATGY
ncbi:MAG: TMEM165/GDT1 family protein [Alphaproteobacteria bacterium]|nr:TMEM165/GDT1 family protein [Alphaproteobacteria bacterium]MBM3952406.1 TMEM165/GDT1 family protein [Rhodospirillales bacterium]